VIFWLLDRQPTRRRVGCQRSMQKITRQAYARRGPGRLAPVTTQHQAAQHAGARLLLGLVGALAVLVAAVPLGILVRAEHPGLVEADLRASQAAERATQDSGALLLAARAVTLLGEPVLLTVAAALLLLVLYGTGHHRLALFVLVARGGAMILSTGLKAIVDRARPVFDEPVATALGGSFPSGHALGSAAFYAMIAVVLAPRLSRAGLLLTAAAAISVLVASSRVLLGVHFPSDVTAGLLIGWGWVALCTAVFAVWRREEGKPADQVGE
jgi:membrane-associated phospholipid phosphatase